MCELKGVVGWMASLKFLVELAKMYDVRKATVLCPPLEAT